MLHVFFGSIIDLSALQKYSSAPYDYQRVEALWNSARAHGEAQAHLECGVTDTAVTERCLLAHVLVSVAELFVNTVADVSHLLAAPGLRLPSADNPRVSDC
jgi:hypothetical protein